MTYRPGLNVISYDCNNHQYQVLAKNKSRWYFYSVVCCVTFSCYNLRRIKRFKLLLSCIYLFIYYRIVHTTQSIWHWCTPVLQTPSAWGRQHEHATRDTATRSHRPARNPPATPRHRCEVTWSVTAHSARRRGRGYHRRGGGVTWTAASRRAETCENCCDD